MDFYSFTNFRQINDEEIHLVWEWRNHIEIRKWMYNQDLIPLENHIKFIGNLKTDDTKQYWLVKRKDVAIGVMSIIGINDMSGEWGYYIAPEFHGKNLGVEFYYYSFEFLFNIMKMEKVFGYALVKNIAANSLNDLFGFDKDLITKEIEGVAYDFYFRNLSKEKFLSKIQNDLKILKLLDFTYLKNI